jgi:hypothetical protein
MSFLQPKKPGDTLSLLIALSLFNIAGLMFMYVKMDRDINLLTKEVAEPTQQIAMITNRFNQRTGTASNATAQAQTSAVGEALANPAEGQKFVIHIGQTVTVEPGKINPAQGEIVTLDKIENVTDSRLETKVLRATFTIKWLLTGSDGITTTGKGEQIMVQMSPASDRTASSADGLTTLSATDVSADHAEITVYFNPV